MRDKAARDRHLALQEAERGYLLLHESVVIMLVIVSHRCEASRSRESFALSDVYAALALRPFLPRGVAEKVPKARDRQRRRSPKGYGP